MQAFYSGISMVKSLIMGVNGQDGHYLSKLLLGKGHKIIGAGRAKKSHGFEYAVCDITHKGQVRHLVEAVAPDEIYNLAGVSSPAICENNPGLAFSVNVNGVENLLSAISECCPKSRLFQASTGYIFKSSQAIKNEGSQIGPDGAYGKNKLLAHQKVAEARATGLFAVNGVLFNHESPLRGTEFVTRKITKAAAELRRGLRSEPLRLGNMDAIRDWGFAGDYAEAMRLMLQASEPKDYIIATGEGHTVTDICKVAFGHLGMDYHDHITIDQSLVRKTGPNVLVGDPSLIRNDLNWSAKTSFKELVEMMVDFDLGEGA
jgi:GDPmannose 4,6-dehydratase